MHKRPVLKKYWAIFLIWLFHLSGIIGVSSGYEIWFISKTPLNLLVSASLFFIVYPIDNLKKLGNFTLFFGVGLFVEWLGVNFGLLFGSYEYGSNFGMKIDGVPILIGVYWALLTFITAEIARFFSKFGWVRILIAASLMVLLDVFMEQLAPRFDYWSFGEHVPLSNYFTWFLVSLILHAVLYISKISGNRAICLHIYFAQLLFFAYFIFFFD